MDLMFISKSFLLALKNMLAKTFFTLTSLPFYSPTKGMSDSYNLNSQ